MLRSCTLVLLFLGLTLPLAAQQVAPEVYTLENGMKFLLLPRDTQPNVIAVGWAARVGSVNERPGITGISHFFEHMMFKGTTTIGTSDADRDGMYIREQETVRSKLRATHLDQQYERWKRGEIADPWDQANDTPEMSDMRARLREIQESQKKVIRKNEFDEIYTRLGASGTNAFTSHDLTFYINNVPSNKLELWAWMESDRLQDSVFREFYQERDVVHEERRMRTESTPTGIYQEQFDAMFWQSSPYSWPVIGWTTDLNSYTREQAQDYFETYYSPNNLVGVIVGDFDFDEAYSLIDRYFGRLERGEEPPRVVTLEMPQLAEKRMNVECDCPPQVEVRYHAVPFGHRDEPALEVMAEILNGVTGRLRKSLIEEQRLATSARVIVDSRKYAGSVGFSGECQAGVDPEKLEEAWYGELEKIQSEPVSERELQKIKNQVLASSYRRLADNFSLMIQLGYYEALGDWEYINEFARQLTEVTSEDIQRVAGSYFDPSDRNVGIYRRKASGGGVAATDPLERFAPEPRAMVRQYLTFLPQMPLEQVEEMVRKMESQVAEAPPDFKIAIEFMIEKSRERLSAAEEEN